MAISFKTFCQIVEPVVSVKHPFGVMIRGPHGIGKSEMVYQLAEIWGLKVVERRTSQMSEGDLMGLPKVEGKSTKWLPPDWFIECCENPRILFLDELDRAITEVRQGVFELGDSRKLNGWNLHPKTLIFAATNSGTHHQANFYQVAELDPAELDRWFIADVAPTAQDWLTWANGKVPEIVWDFVNQNSGDNINHLEHSKEFEANKVYPSRRSMKRFSDVLKHMDVNIKTLDKSFLLSLAEGFIGMEASIAFVDFVDKYERQVSIDDILIHGKHELTKYWTINDHTAFVEKLSASDRLIPVFSNVEAVNFATHFRNMPSEVGMLLFETLSSKMLQSNQSFDEDSLKTANLTTFFEHEFPDGVAVRDIIGRMTGESVKTAAESE